MSDDAPASPRSRLVATGAVLLLGGVTLLLTLSVTVRNESGVRVAAVPLSAAAVTLATVVVVGLATVVSGREGRDRLAVGCLAAGAGGLLPVAAATPALPSVPRAVMLAAPPLTVLAAAVVGTDWSARPVRLRLVSGLVLAATLAHVAAYDPFRDPACTVLCTQVLAPLAPLVPVEALLALVAGLTGGAAALSADAVWRVRRTTPVPVVVTALLGLVLGVLVVAVRWLPPVAPASLGHALLPGLVAATVPCLGVLLAWASTYRSRRAVHSLVRRLGEPGLGVGELPDPVVAVQVAIGEGRWVDVAGREADPLPPPGATAVSLGPDVRLLVREGATRTAGVVGRLGAADLVALSNARLAALTRAHQREVRESQRRIVAVSDAERLRVERDLHDGAQQRLVAAKLHLRLAATWDDDADAAEQDVQRAIELLRTLAHGVFPRLLASDGLVAALDDLASTSPVAVALEVDALLPVESGLSLDARTALYAVVGATVRIVGAAGGSEMLVVRGAARPGWVRLEAEPVVADARALQDAADRVGAAGGHLSQRLADEAGRVGVIAEVPCESS